MRRDSADLVIVLTYYTPYVSGLTNFARDIAEGLSARGRRVTVVATRHDPVLPAEENLNGVRILRAPVLAKLGKGVISPQFVRMAIQTTRRARVANIHLPMLEAGLIAPAAHCPVVLTYHCDVSLPSGIFNGMQRAAIDASSRRAMQAARVIAVTSEDYARHSRLWLSIQPKMVAIPPPCTPVAVGQPTYRETSGLHVGFLGRIVEEKGLEFLVEGFHQLKDPQCRLLIGGDFAKVAGGSVVSRVRERIGSDSRIRLLGFIPDSKLADFYASLDVFALPSVNAFEAFGIVQVVAMLAGVPVLASDLPGVRIPVRETGFGKIVAPQDVSGIASALRELDEDRLNKEVGIREAKARYSVSGVVDAFETLFDRTAWGSPPN